MRRISAHAWPALALLLLAGCGQRKATSSEVVIGTVTGRVTLAARDAAMLRSALDATLSTSHRILRSIDARNPESDITRLNKIAATSRWPVPQDTFRALDLAVHYGRETDGAFDITVSPLAAMWGLPDGPPPAEAPAPEVLAAARGSAGLNQIHLSEDGTVAFLSPLTRIDLGDLAPAYALDLSLVNIRRRSITNALVRFASSVRALGAAAPGQPWQETLFHPDRPGQPIGRWTFKPAGALSVCRLYAREITIAGQRYGGMLDPRNGQPVTNTLGAVVAGPTATLASALAQALVVLGPQGGTNILARFPRYEALIIPAREPLELWMTEGFRRQFEPDPALAQSLFTLAPPPPAPEEAKPEGQAEDTIEAAPANAF